MSVPERPTARLLLRGFRGEDLAPLAAMNADPRVMEHLPGPLRRQVLYRIRREERTHPAGVR